jgi:hypothetical protein
VTAQEAYEWTTRGGATDFARIIAACESFGPYCLIGGQVVEAGAEGLDAGWAERFGFTLRP